MSKPRLGLGKGLGALIPEIREKTAPEVEGGGGVEEISLKKIKPNPYQPRKDFDEEKLKELAGTIKEYGVLQPVILQEKKGEYFLVTGERRFRAALLAGLKTIPALIKEYDERQSMEIALVENLQRENLNPIEEASAYRELLDEFDYLQEELAQKLGRSRSAIANTVRLLALDQEVQNFLAEGRLTVGQARPLLALNSPAEQRKFALTAIDKKLSARQVEKLVREYNNREKKQANDAVVDISEEIQIATLLIKELEDRLRRTYGTKVAIRSGSHEGRVELSFYGEEDLERLTTLLLKEEL
ncbi:MAG: ParB/RepB/Spo0J family partition protein [Firmicutes bacterium]|nr:ParB/RepB/Spo0J family partition protein [Bacillota bacterium]